MAAWAGLSHAEGSNHPCRLFPPTLCPCSWDPIFEAEGFGQTYAEMDKEVRGAERLACLGWQMGLRLKGLLSAGCCSILPV